MGRFVEGICPECGGDMVSDKEFFWWGGAANRVRDFLTNPKIFNLCLKCGRVELRRELVQRKSREP